MNPTNDVLPMVKEVCYETDPAAIVERLNTGAWVVIAGTLCNGVMKLMFGRVA